MPRFVSSMKEHLTTTEFWRALSFVLKRLESIARYLTKLPLPFVLSLYCLHLIRAALRIGSYFYKTKNKNLGATCKCLFALFKVSIALIALVLLGGGVVSLPSVLLGSFFAYNILKLIHSAVVLLASTIAYLNIDKQRIEQQWRRAQYHDNMTKHVCILGTGLLFMLLSGLLSAGTCVLIWSNPLLLLLDGVILITLLAVVVYWVYTIAKNKRIAAENIGLTKEQILKLRRFLLLFGFAIAAALLTVLTPSLGVSAIVFSLILLSVEDVLLTIYYYFFGVYIPNPEPANLSEASLRACIAQRSRDYYQTFFPILYLQTQVSEKLQQVKDVNKANKKFILKITLLKLLELENKLEKIVKSSRINQFFSSKKKLNIKKEYLLRELAWALNTDDKEALIDLFILAIIDISENKEVVTLENNLCELLDLLGTNNRDGRILYHPFRGQKNSVGQLFFLSQQAKWTQPIEIVKPKAFYQSFWKKVGACDALSQAFRASRSIEEQISLSHPSWQPS